MVTIPRRNIENIYVIGHGHFNDLNILALSHRPITAQRLVSVNVHVDNCFLTSSQDELRVTFRTKQRILYHGTGAAWKSLPAWREEKSLSFFFFFWLRISKDSSPLKKSLWRKLDCVAKFLALLDSAGKRNRELEGKHEWERARMRDRLRYGRRAAAELRNMLVGLPKKIKNKIQKEKRRMASVRQRAIRNSWKAASIFAPLSPEGPVKVRRVPSEPDSRPHFISRRDVFISRTLLSSFTPSAVATRRHAVGRWGDSFDVAVQMCRLVFVYLFCERWPAAGEGRGVSSSCSLEEAGSRWKTR